MQICARLLKHLKLSRSPRFNYTFLRRFVRDDFLAIFFLSKHFPLTFCAQGFWKNNFLPPKFVHVLCKFFKISLRIWSRFLKKRSVTPRTSWEGTVLAAFELRHGFYGRTSTFTPVPVSAWSGPRKNPSSGDYPGGLLPKWSPPHKTAALLKRSPKILKKMKRK